MSSTLMPETTIEPPPAQPRPGWAGFRWGALAGGLYGVAGGAVLGYFAALFDPASESISSSASLLPTLAVFLLPTVVIAALLTGIGGAITGVLIYQTVRRIPALPRGLVWLVAVGVCLLVMLLVAMPVLATLYMDGNFLRGLEESMIFGIPFYILPGIFYMVAMAVMTHRNYPRWIA